MGAFPHDSGVPDPWMTHHLTMTCVGQTRSARVSAAALAIPVLVIPDLPRVLHSLIVPVSSSYNRIRNRSTGWLVPPRAPRLSQCRRGALLNGVHLTRPLAIMWLTTPSAEAYWVRAVTG